MADTEPDTQTDTEPGTQARQRVTVNNLHLYVEGPLEDRPTHALILNDGELSRASLDIEGSLPALLAVVRKIEQMLVAQRAEER